MARIPLLRFAFRSIRGSCGLVVAILFLGLLVGCTDDPAVPSTPPVVQAALTVLYYGSPTPDPASYATCETGAAVLLLAHGSHDPVGLPLEFEWRDLVDLGDGIPVLSPDWGPGANPLRTAELELPAHFSSIGVHYLTLTGRARDGRSASQTLRTTVLACQSCGP